ncbi:MAG: M3 family oligoendopeptidase [Bacteroidota bacterium]
MTELPVRPPRQFLPESFTITDFNSVKAYTDRLLDRPLTDAISLRRWLTDRSELEAVLAEDFGWRYIHMTCETENQEYLKRYQEFIETIQPHLAVVADQLNRKVLDCPYLTELEHEEGYDIMIRSMRKEVEIYREENVPLFTELNTLAQQYARISGAMTVEIDGQEMTLQQASVILQETDRNRREKAWRTITERRLKDSAELDDLFTRMVRLRHQVAVNAGFSNFRDYMFKSLGRFDYTPQDCVEFHESVSSEVVPLLAKLAAVRKDRLGVEALRPWDKAVDEEGRAPLKAFDGGKDLLERSIRVFSRLDPYLGQCLDVMREMGHLDLESRKGKAPGGYNYPLAEIGVPFIFMNATSTLRDLTTLMHEGGHAVHNFLTRDLLLQEFKSPPMEVAELASMSMELMTMDLWDEFFSGTDDLRRARLEQLEDIIETLPWVATIDSFQHWIYEHPEHSADERRAAWRSILSRFSDGLTDWSGLENAMDFLWQKQLHLYEVPFYYIEYGMAQLGAVAIWRNYRMDPAKALAGYKQAWSLGYLKGIPEIYAAAGIRFSFTKDYIRELTGFLSAELGAIKG